MGVEDVLFPPQVLSRGCHARCRIFHTLSTMERYLGSISDPSPRWPDIVAHRTTTRRSVARYGCLSRASRIHALSCQTRDCFLTLGCLLTCRAKPIPLAPGFRTDHPREIPGGDEEDRPQGWRLCRGPVPGCMLICFSAASECRTRCLIACLFAFLARTY